MSISFADDATSRECERLFQNGGPKVYVREQDAHAEALRPSPLSAKRAQESAFPGEQVFARHKFGGVYRWVAFPVQ